MDFLLRIDSIYYHFLELLKKKGDKIEPIEKTEEIRLKDYKGLFLDKVA